jgi:hypothetical protein
MNKIWIILLLIAGFGLTCRAAIEAAVNTPVFERPHPDARVIGVVPAAMKLESTGDGELVFVTQHPLAVYHRFFPVVLPDGGGGFVAPKLRVERGEDGGLRLYSVGHNPLWRQVWLLAAAAALLLALLDYRKRLLAGTLAAGSAREAGYFVAFAVLLRHILLLSVVIGGDNIVCAAADEPGYFQVAYDLLHGSAKGPWSYPVGLGVFFYLPAILLTGATKYYDFAVPFSYFSGFVLAPLALAVGFAVLRKLGIGNRPALAATLLWAVYPFFVFQGQDWNREIFTSAVMPTALGWSFRYYTSLIGAGFNAMSDTPSTLLVLTTLLAALSLPARRRGIAAVAALFAVCCLLRLNNIFFAPVIGYALYCRHREKLADPRYFAGAALTGAAVYLGCLLPQFWVNFHQFGSLFTFSYVLHYQDFAPIDRPDAGFTWHTFWRGRNMLFLGGCNFVVWAAGIAGLLTLGDRFRRTMLALWAIPVILFFLGYSHTYCDAARFIMSTYLPLLAAFTGAELWRVAGPRMRWASGIAIASTVIGSVPFMIYQPWFAALRLQSDFLQLFFMVAFPITALGFGLLLRRGGHRRPAAFLLLFAALYCLANAYILVAFLVLILLRTLFDVAAEVTGKDVPAAALRRVRQMGAKVKSGKNGS